MNKILKFFFKPITLLNDFREKLEDSMAATLEKVDSNESIDKLEKKGVVAAIKAGSKLAVGTCIIPNEYLEKIADVIVEDIVNKANPKIVKQLRK